MVDGEDVCSTTAVPNGQLVWALGYGHCRLLKCWRHVPGSLSSPSLRRQSLTNSHRLEQSGLCCKSVDKDTIAKRMTLAKWPISRTPVLHDCTMMVDLKLFSASRCSDCPHLNSLLFNNNVPISVVGRSPLNFASILFSVLCSVQLCNVQLCMNSI